MDASIYMQELMKKKEKIEADIKALSDVLDSQKGVGLKEPLVDAEGYPRSDIDVYSVRHARHEIICLQNDHKELMKEIEEELYRLHEEARKTKQTATQRQSPVQTVRIGSSKPMESFATIDRVDKNSPAENAGLQVGDEILCIGSITKENFSSLQSLAQLVQHSKNTPLVVKVQRGGNDVQLTLVPKTWEGRGLLGCNILPIKR